MQSKFSQIPQILNLDLRTFVEFFQTLLLRHIEYQNYLMYISEHMPERQNEIIGIQNLVEKCHIVRNDILSGRMNINLCEFVNRELKKLTFENIHKCSKIQYHSQLDCLLESFNNQLMQQQKFLQIVKQNQTLQFKRNKKSEKITVEYMRHQILMTEQEIISLNQTVKDESHLPVLQTEEIQVEMSDNKEIPKNTLRIKIKRILMGPTSKFYLKFLYKDEQYSTNSNNSAGIFNYQQDIQIDGKTLSQQIIEIRLYQACRIFSYKEVLVAKINLNSLDWSNQVDDYLPYPTQDYPECKIEYCLQLREAIVKTNNQATFTTKHFIKTYPKLELNRGQLEYEGTYLPKAIQLFELKIAHFKQSIEQSVFQQNATILESIVVSQKQNESPKEQVESTKEHKKQVENPKEILQQKQPPQTKQIEGKPEEKDQNEIQIIVHGGEDDELIRSNQDKIPNGLTLEDVLQPENPKKSPVSGFVVEYKKLIEKQMMILRGPQRRQAQNILEDFMRQEIFLKKLADNEQFEEYLSLIKDLPKREQKLLEFYQSLKLTGWVKVIQFRLEKLNEELLALGVEEKTNQDQIQTIQPTDETLTSENIQLIVHGNEDDELIKSKQDKIPKGLSLEDVLQPENPKKSPVSGFVVEYKKLIEKQMMILRGPQRRQAQNILEDFMRSEIQLGNLAKNGQIEQYLAMIKNLPQREDQLIMFYDEIGLGEWSKVVRYRKQILLEELEGLS